MFSVANPTSLFVIQALFAFRMLSHFAHDLNWTMMLLLLASQLNTRWQASISPLVIASLMALPILDTIFLTDSSSCFSTPVFVGLPSASNILQEQAVFWDPGFCFQDTCIRHKALHSHFQDSCSCNYIAHFLFVLLDWSERKLKTVSYSSLHVLGCGFQSTNPLQGNHRNFSCFIS